MLGFTHCLTRNRTGGCDFSISGQMITANEPCANADSWTGVATQSWRIA